MTTPRQQFETAARPLALALIDHAMKAGAAHGITDARISVSRSAAQENEIENGAVSKSVSGVSWNVGIALYAGDRVLKFGQNTTDLATLKAAIDQNLPIINMVPENPYDRLLEPGLVYKGAIDDHDLYDAAPPTQDELIAYAVAVEAAAMAVPGVKTARSNSIEKSEGHSLVLATNGLDRLESQTSYSAGIAAVAEDACGMQIAGDQSFAAHFSDLIDPAIIGRTAGEDAAARLNPRLPQSGEASIILSPDAARTFFGSVMQAIDGTALYRNATFLKGGLGQQVLNPSITIEDDPRVSRALRSQTVDSAGMESRKVTFIDKGVLKQFNLSLGEARKLGMAPIGRSGGYTNLRVAPGDKSPDELMADIKEGFYIRGFKGGTADVATGRFSRQAFGNVIRDGKITGEAVAGFVVSGALKDIFLNAVVANDTPQLPDGRHTSAVPTVRLDGMKIAGR